MTSIYLILPIVHLRTKGHGVCLFVCLLCCSTSSKALGLTLSLTEVTGIFLWVKFGGRVRLITAICELTLQNKLDPRRLTTLCASRACYRGSFTCFLTLAVAFKTGRRFIFTEFSDVKIWRSAPPPKKKNKQETNSVALSPRANYTD
jgi:hypothetical protein